MQNYVVGGIYLCVLEFQVLFWWSRKQCTLCNIRLLCIYVDDMKKKRY